MSISSAVIRLTDLVKHFETGGEDVLALDGVSLSIPEGQMCALMGPSGAGKSTLLHLLAGLTTHDKGDINIGGVDISSMSRDEMTALRRRKIGVVFQSFNLLPYLNAFDNIALPLRLDSVAAEEAKNRVEKCLNVVGLSKRAGHLPSQLSGGEMQRVAIARALVIDPILLLADEPTGNLDSTAARHIMSLLKDINETTNVTMVVVTHDPIWASFCDRVVRMVDGRVSEDVTLDVDAGDSLASVSMDSN